MSSDSPWTYTSEIGGTEVRRQIADQEYMGRLMKKDFYLSRAIHLVILPDHKCFQDVCCPWYYSCELAVG